MPGDLDHDRLLAEIDDEVRRRRETGEIPVELERELQKTFARYAPPSAGHGDLAATIEAVRNTSLIDLEANVESARPGVAEAKKAIRKAIAFQMRHVALQINNLGITASQALDMLSDRLDALETVEATRRIRPEPPIVDDAWLPADAIMTTVADVDGRVLHVGAASGRVVRAARERGVDAYGIEADARRSADAGDDIRTIDPLEHCRTIADATLGAVILSVEEASLLDHLTLLTEALRSTRPGGRIVIVTRDADAWAEAVGPVVVDLSMGTPLAPATWATALEQYDAGTVAVESVDGGPVHLVTGTRR